MTDDALLALLRTAVTDMEPDVARFLREELERADIVSGEVSPTAVVSIGSAVKFIDHAAMKIRQVKSWCFPMKRMRSISFR